MKFLFSNFFIFLSRIVKLSLIRMRFRKLFGWTDNFWTRNEMKRWKSEKRRGTRYVALDILAFRRRSRALFQFRWVNWNCLPQSLRAVCLSTVLISPRRRSFGLRTRRIRVDVTCLYGRVTSLMELIPFVTT